ncbi:MAG TPA: 50S ribosomal protein L25 [Clostridiales bacterium]|nr:50S ribosomal protein L25 [Clostridiales bacterium]
MYMKISCIPRDITGTRVSRRLRKEDFVPGVIYGKGKEPSNISVARKDIDKVIKYHGENAILELSLNGKEMDAMIKEVQKDPIQGTVTHLDLYQISKDQKVQVSVPIHLLNVDLLPADSALVRQLDEIEIECAANIIPRNIEIDVEGLKIGHAIHISDITFAEGITVLEDDEAVIVSLSQSRVEVDEVEEEEVEETEPVLIGSDEDEE